MSGTVDGRAFLLALHKKAGEAFKDYQRAKSIFLEASEVARVRKLKCEAAKKTWQRCSAAVVEVSATLAEYNMGPSVNEEREKYMGGDAQDHEGEESEGDIGEDAQDHECEEGEEDIGGDAQDHEGVAEDLTQKIDATDDEEEEENLHEGEEEILAITDHDTDRKRAARSRTPPQRSLPDTERPSAIALPQTPTLTPAQETTFRARYPYGIPQTPGSTPRSEMTAEERAQKQQMEELLHIKAEQRAQRQHMEELLEGKNVSYRQPSTNLNK